MPADNAVILKNLVPGAVERPRVLYLVHRFPYPPNKGDRIRAFHIIRYLSRRSDLHVMTLADTDVSRHDQTALAEYCRLDVVRLAPWARYWQGFRSIAGGRSITEGMFFSTELARRIQREASSTPYDRVVVSASSMLPYLQLPALRNTPALVDLVDVDSEKWRQYAAASPFPMRRLFNLESSRVRRLEMDVPGSVRSVALVSEAETDLFRNICREHSRSELARNSHTIPNGVDLDYFAPAEIPHEPRCVFVGAMNYFPNANGVQWFCRHVWPLVRERFPNAVFSIVGHRPPRSVRQLAAIPGVEVVGSVPDVRPWIAQSCVCIVPLRIARGVQNKVLEAMAMARPVIASQSAITGIRVQPGRHLLQADSIEEWRLAIDRVLTQPQLRAELAAAARKFVEENHNWTTLLAQVGDRLELTPHNPLSLRRWPSQLSLAE